MYSREDYLDPNAPAPARRETTTSMKPQPESVNNAIPSHNAKGLVRRFTLASWMSIYGKDCYQDFVRESDYANLERENAELREENDELRAHIHVLQNTR